MAEQNEDNKYMKCSKCRMNYTNDEEHIESDFGYTKLNERYKTWCKFRTNRKDNWPKYKEKATAYAEQYREAHKEQVLASRREYNKRTTICDVCKKQLSLSSLTRPKKSHHCEKKKQKSEWNPKLFELILFQIILKNIIWYY